MYGLFALIGFIAIIYLIEKWSKERYKNGDKLPKSVRPYYYRIKQIINPYITIYFSQRVIYLSQELLKSIYHSYDSIKSQGELDNKEISVFLINNNNVNFIIDCFACAYLYKLYVRTIASSDEERNAENSIKNYCKNKLKQFGKEIPIVILDYFEINIDQL